MIRKKFGRLQAPLIARFCSQATALYWSQTSKLLDKSVPIVLRSKLSGANAPNFSEMIKS